MAGLDRELEDWTCTCWWIGKIGCSGPRCRRAGPYVDHGQCWTSRMSRRGVDAARAECWLYIVSLSRMGCIFQVLCFQVRTSCMAMCVCGCVKQTAVPGQPCITQTNEINLSTKPKSFPSPPIPAASPRSITLRGRNPKPRSCRVPVLAPATYPRPFRPPSVKVGRAGDHRCSPCIDDGDHGLLPCTVKPLVRENSPCLVFLRLGV
ncbi:hypothetical protein DE146DRAFT_426797 [Phaeosphaeria sp. MPI-PUGE-AT-0046c]|nr:hypothetical protein DE146DRAFT_426797 [Phaeosphaeria sp. MPI-PUGE-AT-0046c]